MSSSAALHHRSTHFFYIIDYSQFAISFQEIDLRDDDYFSAAAGEKKQGKNKKIRRRKNDDRRWNSRTSFSSSSSKMQNNLERERKKKVLRQFHLNLHLQNMRGEYLGGRTSYSGARM